MRRWLFPIAMLAALLALSACAAKEEALPVEGPAPVAPATPAPEVAPAWQEEWERTLEAAKKEGAVAILGPSGDLARRALEAFERRYGIKVQYMGGVATALATRVKTERAARQYLWDIWTGGLGSILPQIDEMDPIPPALILPEVKDPKNWWGGQVEFLDNDPRILVVSYNTSNPIFINTKLVKAEEIKSFKDLLAPKWKGKILSDDPRGRGAAISQYSFWYQHPELGPDFIRALAKQDLTITQDQRQQFEWLAYGKFPILIGGSRGQEVRLVQEGLPIVNMDPRGIKEGGYIASGNGHVLLFNRAPHPNAAKVFINWILTEEGQTAWLRALGIPSLRLDVKSDWVQEWVLPQKGYLNTASLGERTMREKVREFLIAEVFGP